MFHFADCCPISKKKELDETIKKNKKKRNK